MLAFAEENRCDVEAAAGVPWVDPDALVVVIQGVVTLVEDLGLRSYSELVPVLHVQLPVQVLVRGPPSLHFIAFAQPVLW